MRYKRACIESTIKAAKRSAAVRGVARFIVATYSCYGIFDRADAFQDSIKVNPDGSTEKVLGSHSLRGRPAQC